MDFVAPVGPILLFGLFFSLIFIACREVHKMNKRNKEYEYEFESSTTCERKPWRFDDIASYEMFKDGDELKRLYARKKFLSYWHWGCLDNIPVLAKIALEQVEKEIAVATKKPKKTTKPKKSTKKAKGS